MTKEITLETYDPKPAIRRNAETARDWEFHEEATYLYDMSVLFRDRLIDPIRRIDRDVVPDPLISFDNSRNSKVLASYTLGRNAQGINDEITFNTAHYEEKEGKPVWKYGRWSQLETLLHEETHLFLEYLNKLDGKERPAHGKQFVEKCESMGLHVRPVIGSHYQVADGVFAELMKELGIERPDDVPREDPKADWFRPKKEKGKSTLTKWTCPDCGLNVRIGIQDDPHLIHEDCGTALIKAEKGVIYKPKK